MRNIILIILLFITTISGYSQTEYPYIIETDGKPIVVITYDQANKLVNKAELLDIYELYFNERTRYDSLTIKLIKSQSDLIFMQDISIADYKNLLELKNNRIDILFNQVELYKNENANILKQNDNILKKSEQSRKNLKIYKILNSILIVIVVILLY